MNNSLSSSSILLVLSSPSGAGKSTIAQAVTKMDPNAELAISYTTRDKRPKEGHGKDYYFTEHEKFLDMVARDEFLEYAMIYDKLYGTPKKEVVDLLDSGRDVVFDIDCQGYKSIKQQIDSSVISVFIMPPSLDTLKERLIRRSSDNEEAIEMRMNEAINEISQHVDYDYVVINDELDQAVHEICSILKAERLKRTRLKDLERFILGLGG